MIVMFSHPEPVSKSSKIFPIFMPFSGCVERCIFCSQTTQTGVEENSSIPIQKKQQTAFKEFAKAWSNAKNQPFDLAFYGGTFTALPLEEQLTWLALAKKWKNIGAISKIRCSTRPDTVNLDLLLLLKSEGLDLVELGIQSFDSFALATANRKYSSKTAVNACQLVQKAGLELGIQLMPGMPGVNTKIAQADVVSACNCHPQYVRMYPCLVFAGTPLEHIWHQKKFIPWNLEQTITFLAESCLQFWKNNIRVIRMGVAPEPEAVKNILAGPFHPSLGNMVKSNALFFFIKEYISTYLKEKGVASIQHINVPKKYQGELWGFKKNLQDPYESIGITPSKISWSNDPNFYLNFSS